MLNLGMSGCECPQNQVCYRVINYEVAHFMPYNHTYTPGCSYSEVENVYQNRCCR